MRQLREVAADVTGWLSANGFPFALIGGLAVSFRTIERFTKDIDLAIAAESDQQAEQCVRALSGIGYKVQMLLEQRKHDRIATVRLMKAGEEGAVVDLLFASSGIEAEIVMAAEPIEVFEHLVVPVATVAGLLALKVLSVDPARRPQDAVDIKNLLSLASASDTDEAHRLLRLVQERGYNRGKNLLAEFEHYRRIFQ
jgi:predicted nucleotidyltransferase